MSGVCFALGCDHIAASHNAFYHSTSAFSLYIGFFQTMHNIRQRGQRPSVLMRAVLDKKSLLSPLLALLLTPAP